MHRRKAIQNIGLTFGAVVSMPSALSLLQSCQSVTPWVPVFFTKDEGIVLKNLSDALLPASNNLPSASEVNVHVFIDKYVGEVLSPEEQGGSRTSITTLMAELLQQAGVSTVEKLKSEDYTEFLNFHLNKSQEEHYQTLAQINAYTEENGGNIENLDKEMQIYGFLVQLRTLSITAYKTNERVGENILAYRPVPGQQQGCVDLQATTGGMAWSL